MAGRPRARAQDRPMLIALAHRIRARAFYGCRCSSWQRVAARTAPTSRTNPASLSPPSALPESRCHSGTAILVRRFLNQVLQLGPQLGDLFRNPGDALEERLVGFDALAEHERRRA